MPVRHDTAIAEIPGDRLELAVADNAIGTSTDAGFSGGTGFGLSLVTMLADQLHA